MVDVGLEIFYYLLRAMSASTISFDSLSLLSILFPFGLDIFGVEGSSIWMGSDGGRELTVGAMVEMLTVLGWVVVVVVLSLVRGTAVITVCGFPLSWLTPTVSVPEPPCSGILNTIGN